MSLGRVTLRVPFGLVMISMVMITCATSASDKDKNECTEQLVGLATCLPYVGETAKSPTPDCCNGLKQVLNTNKKCLCVIVKDRNDPDLGLSINVTLALGLPSVCHAPANISQCPELLHLAPNSPDAQVFYQFGHGSGASASATSPISSVKGNTTSANSTGTSASKDSSGIMKRLVDWKVIVGGAGAVLLWGFTSN